MSDVVAVQENAKLRAALSRLTDALTDLAASSDGVAGLHMNGDLAPWSELLPGGRFADWLGDPMEEAHAALGIDP